MAESAPTPLDFVELITTFCRQPIISYILSITLVAVALTVYYLEPFYRRRALRSIPGPRLAAFSNVWLFYQARKNRRWDVINQLHEKHGPLVRIQPNHISVSSVEDINTIYGHGKGLLKSGFYDAFTNVDAGLFSTRDRAEHTRKRKLVSHAFSSRNIGYFEEFLRQNLERFCTSWDQLIQGAHVVHQKGKQQQPVLIDLMPWMNYLAFDIISDLSFGQPLGMVKRGKDMAEIRLTPESPPTQVSAIHSFSRRSELNAALGCSWPWLKPYARYLPDPFCIQGARAAREVAGLGHAQVTERLNNPDKFTRPDILGRLMQGRDRDGKPLGRKELTAEALTQLVAGSDTMSVSACALLFHVISDGQALGRVRQELRDAVPQDQLIPLFDQIKNLPYLQAVIKETLRVHAANASGLPRVVPAGSTVIICGQVFPEGTVFSVPAYTVHHDKQIWGPDADVFRPERFLNKGLTPAQEMAYIPFGVGPRACSGRNLAEMQLALTAATILRRYDFDMYEDMLHVKEGFLRKPVKCHVGVQHLGPIADEGAP